MDMEIAERIRTLLVFLYGETQADQVWPELIRLVEERHGRLRATPAAAQPLSEKDAILITYADTFTRSGERPLHTLRRFLQRHVPGAFSGIHLLPFYPYTSDDGFSVIDYYQVDPPLGNWHDVAELGEDYRLMFDAVLNHVSQASAWFRGFQRGQAHFQDYFITPPPSWDLTQVVRPRTQPLLTTVTTAAGSRQVWTTFGADQIDLNYANPRVLLEIIALLLFYVAQGASILRLDAIAYLWKTPGTTCVHLPQTHAVVKLLRAVLDWVAPHVLLITETNVPHADNISYFGETLPGERTDEAQLVYQFPLAPLLLHTFATGSSLRLSEWAGALAAPGLFFNFTASHDGIGVQPARALLDDAEIEGLVERALAHGGRVSHKANLNGSRSPYELNTTWFDALNDRANPQPRQDRRRFLASQAIMLSLAGVPGVYVHSLFGSRNCHACLEQTGRARSLNREKFAVDQLAAALTARSGHARAILAGYCQLLGARKRNAAFHPRGAQQVVPVDPAVFALARVSPRGDQCCLCLVNVTAARQEIEVVPRDHGLPAARIWTDVLAGRTVATRRCALRGTLAPYEVLWLAPSSQSRER